MGMDADPRNRTPFRRKLRKWRHRLRNQKRIRSATKNTATIILLHQMGKVGSSSIKASLEGLCTCHVFHTHWCNPKNLAYHAGVLDESQRVSNRYGDRDHFGEMVNAQIIQPGLASKMVTLVRDPVARNVSSYFQHLDEIWGIRRAWAHVPISDLAEGFLRIFEHNEPLDWFDTEVRDMVGIDVMKHRFQTDRKFSIMSNEKWTLLLMRSDLPDDRKHVALEQLVGTNVPEIQRTNVGSKKAYASIYKQFKRELVLPEAHLDLMYKAPISTHFFSAEEIRGMRSRWSMAA